jgi:ABC-type transporter Mla MlaB component
MVTKSSSTTLLSRFAQLFRESEADDDADSNASAPAVAVAPAEPSLRQRLERKRRNDAIKVKEFKRLRAIIQGGRGIKYSYTSDLTSSSALVRTSGMGTLERNSILDKIDGAEAHLENWWGTNTTPAPVAAPRAQIPPSVAQASFMDDMDLDFTDLQGEGETEPEPVQPEPRHTAPSVLEELPLSALDTCMRDAALHHAEGEFSQAQQLLTKMLHDTSLTPESAEALTFALFDVYRCTGQQDRFDALAMDYANRFGRSPGEWFSLEEPAAISDSGSAAQESAFSQLARETIWKCPAILDQHGLADCISRNPASAALSFINWEALQHIDNAIAPAFARQLKIWCEEPVDLHWTGVDTLLAAVQMCKVSGDAARDAAWWLIHLDLLCILEQEQTYEDTALEYCIAFEVSPPSWAPAKCKLNQDNDFALSSVFATTSASKDIEEAIAIHSPYAVCELQGNLTDEARRALRALRAASGSVGQLTVSCAHLGRVDFNAASAILNWAVNSDAKGCQVQFVQLPRLVLVFFEMLGMHKVASLSSGPK